jgi:2-succinyl-5-enolpyruvyl-6-hydroxy-3-cyclohexene-1-carboxylate synthase
MVDALVNSKAFNLITEIDERNAGFVALGLSLNSPEPAAIVCTSGSAVLNLLPALSEAKHQNQCIIAITCDRPTEWIGQQDSQTIDHLTPLKPFCARQGRLQNDNLEQHAWYNTREINRCLNSDLNAPVQINIPLSDPLYQKTDYNKSAYSSFTATEFVGTTKRLTDNTIALLNSEIDKAKSIVILCGQLPPADGQRLSDALKDLATRITLIAENTSNLQIDGIRTIDPWVMAVQKLEKVEQPDIIVSLGGHFVSKKIKHLIRACHKSEIWRIADEHYYPDTFQHLNKVINANPWEVLNCIDVTESKKMESWERLYSQLPPFSETPISDSNLADLEVYKETNEVLGENDNLIWHYGNSSSIRYAQLFPYSKSAHYYANRGVSGIEGCISTAKGVALAYPTKTNILMIGDLAFAYNMNGLQNLPFNLKIVLVNNTGGNIFRLIDGPSEVQGFESFVECHNNTEHKLATQHFGIVYLTANTLADFKSNLTSLIDQEKAGVLEVFTDRHLNKNILKNHLQQFTNGKQENLEDN